MNIKETLISHLLSMGYGYGCNISELVDFMDYRGNYKSKCNMASRIIKDIMTVHGKKNLSDHIDELGRVEYATRELKDYARDHVVHALNTLILGLYLSDKFFGPYIGIVDEFQWKIASLFHDVGYPLEIANGICNSFQRVIDETKNSLHVHGAATSMWVQTDGLSDLSNGEDSLRLIEKRLEKWDLDTDKIFEHANTIRFCDHGIYSALLILNIIDQVYQKYNPERKKEDVLIPGTYISCNQKYFEEDVVSACSAIFLHNLPSKCFVNKKIDRDSAKIAFLLKLSDTLQEWDRPSLADSTGHNSDYFDIDVEPSGTLNFITRLSSSRVEKIREDINGCLKNGLINIIKV